MFKYCNSKAIINPRKQEAEVLMMEYITQENFIIKIKEWIHQILMKNKSLESKINF